MPKNSLYVNVNNSDLYYEVACLYQNDNKEDLNQHIYQELIYSNTDTDCEYYL